MGEDNKFNFPLHISLVISETSTSTWNYHLRSAKQEEIRLGGIVAKALCGKIIGWDTKIPLSAWGTKTHLNEKWCQECFKLASEGN